MTTQVKIAEDYGRNSAKKMIVHDTEIPNFEARLALSLIERWGMITGTVAGEDSAGRAKIQDLTPSQVVERACAIADGAAEAFRNRGWFVTAPDISELFKKTDD